MSIPTNIEDTIDYLWRQIKDSKTGHFSLENRARLIRFLSNIEEEPNWYSDLRFYSSPDVKTNELIHWLSLVTAEKVLPIWENANVFQFKNGDNYKFLPRQIIKLAENLITGKTDFNFAKSKLNGDYYYMPMTMAKLTTLNIYRVIECANSALSIPLYGLEPRLQVDDFASLACDAYAGFDENPPGFLYEFTFSRMNIEIQTYLSNNEIKDITELLEKLGSENLFEVSKLLGLPINEWSEQEKTIVKDYKPLRLNEAKVFDFWRWWLIEAIPQAWELAQQFTNK